MRNTHAGIKVTKQVCDEYSSDFRGLFRFIQRCKSFHTNFDLQIFGINMNE